MSITDEQEEQRAPSTYDLFFKNSGNWECSSGDLFIFDVIEGLFRLGTPGIPTETATEEVMWTSMLRGNVFPNGWFILLPLVGIYTLCLWVVRLWNIEKDILRKTNFYYGNINGKIESAPPMDSSKVIAKVIDVTGVEWGILNQFIDMAERLGEMRLHLIPPFSSMPSLQLKTDPKWQGALKKQECIFQKYPNQFILSKPTPSKKVISVDLAATLTKDQIIKGMWGHMAGCEEAIREYLRINSEKWNTLRASDRLSQDDATQINEDFMNLQYYAWGNELFIEDRKLATTAALMTFMKPEPVEEKRQNALRKNIDRDYNRKAGIKAGRSNVKTKLDDTVVLPLIQKIMNDLMIIQREIWPRVYLTGHSNPIRETKELKKAIKDFSLEHIKASHAGISFDQIKNNEPLDLLAKITSNYLEDKTGSRYGIKAIKQAIKKFKEDF